MLPVQDKLIATAIKEVNTGTWNWSHCFLHEGVYKRNPIFEQAAWNNFCQKWSVGRTIRKGTRDQLRLHLVQSKAFAEALKDRTGKKLGELAVALSAEYGAVNSRNKKPAVILSALSKTAAFLKPKIFVAWDTYASRGLNLAHERPAGAKYLNGYPQYLTDFNRLWVGEYGERIRATLTAQRVQHADDPRFSRRVLDLYLMNLAGREIEKLGKSRLVTSAVSD